MNKTIISLILLMTPYLQALAADASALKDDAPDRYTVVKGDTLWSISGRFLKDPWKWPEVWKMNQDQIKNPNRIYPGDVVVLDRSGSDAQLRLIQANTVKLSPRVRSTSLADAAVPAIPPSVVEPFLSRPLVVGANELDDAPIVTAARESRVTMGPGDTIYAAGITKEKGTTWQLYRRGDPLIDPDSGETLGYVATYLGEARVVKFGDQSTLEITRSVQEIYTGDRLIAASKERPTFSYVPHAPGKSVRGRVLTTYSGLWETGPSGIVALSKGARDGLEVGHVLAIYRSQSSDDMRASPLYMEGNRPRVYYTEELTTRNGPMYPEMRMVTPRETANLPDERYGLVMVFRTFDRAAFGLIMNASRPVALNDIVTNP
ncbi:MAG TPA: LysM peptidoglycan-binding domain-containing protein [Burkholderiales bacterium]|nr:LysM peptidoglycan-binding domain-containing protein [Burkholderiales bacterium]